LREAIRAVLRETDFKVLVCPEDKSQMAVGKRWIVDRLEARERERVVWREQFWLTDEALSTYVRSAGLFGLEMHSPIMCIGNGVPAIVCRFEEQTSKGIMWRDIGLGDWLFDFDRDEETKRLGPAVVEMLTNRAGALRKVEQARKFVQAAAEGPLKEEPLRRPDPVLGWSFVQDHEGWQDIGGRRIAYATDSHGYRVQAKGADRPESPARMPRQRVRESR
jgi:hypothetical protein